VSDEVLSSAASAAQRDQAERRAAGAPATTTKEDIELCRRINWAIHEAEIIPGLRHGYYVEPHLVMEATRQAAERNAMPVDRRLDDILKNALTSGCKLDPNIYELIWTLRQMLAQYGATSVLT